MNNRRIRFAEIMRGVPFCSVAVERLRTRRAGPLKCKRRFPRSLLCGGAGRKDTTLVSAMTKKKTNEENSNVNQNARSGFRLKAPARHSARSRLQSGSKADPSLRSGFRLRTPAQILRAKNALRISPEGSRSPFGSLTPSKGLKMQRGTFGGSLAVRSIRKRPDARHFVCLL
jgi:hypothetical protein